ncbi:hypothetical protein PVAP13_9KG063357 [Panicum virgatum]|uniref:Uncharacterized protein n=1 Tax=Panicum virgatum TaxID=38727 RepID=A0A8T0NJD5_PANVG|nr:hypothetical protein PVAP13_9KG063357 [Panicum virgatum]
MHDSRKDCPSGHCQGRPARTGTAGSHARLTSPEILGAAARSGTRAPGARATRALTPGLTSATPNPSRSRLTPARRGKIKADTRKKGEQSRAAGTPRTNSPASCSLLLPSPSPPRRGPRSAPRCLRSLPTDPPPMRPPRAEP